MAELPVFDFGTDRREAERLSQAWNALVRGEPDATAALDRRDAEVIQRLIALGHGQRPRPDFVERLKEQLMDTAFPSVAGGNAGTAPRRSTVSVASPGRVAPGRRQRRWSAFPFGLGAAATAVMVVVSLVATYLMLAGSHRGTPPGDLGGFGAATPAASPASSDASAEVTYAQDGGPVFLQGRGFINTADYREAELAGDRVQLQGWRIAPGATIDLPAGAAGPGAGIVVDVVLEGAYVVTIDGPAVVSRNTAPAGLRRFVEYVPAGTTIELGRGDTISYPAGRARTIVNPLSLTDIELKSAVFWGGEAPPALPEPLPDGLRHVRVDGDGTLPMPLADYGSFEISITLDYISVHPDAPLPEQRGSEVRIVGPVDPQESPTSGYVLWVGEVLG